MVRNIITKYSDSIDLLTNLDELKKEIDVLDLMLYCYNNNIDTSHIKELNDEVYMILIMMIIVNNKVSGLSLKDIEINYYLQRLLYLSLDEKLWIGKSLDKLYLEIITSSLTTNYTPNNYLEEYNNIKDSYKDYRRTNNSFIVRREIMMMLDKNLSLNELEEQVKTSPSKNMFYHYYEDDNIQTDIKYMSENVILNLIGCVYHYKNRKGLEDMINNDSFFKKDDKIYYGKFYKHIEYDDTMLLTHRKKIRQLIGLDNSLHSKFIDVINKEYNRYYQTLTVTQKVDLHSYLSTNNYHELTVKYDMISLEMKEMLSLIYVQEKKKFLDDIILSNCYKKEIYCIKYSKTFSNQ